MPERVHGTVVAIGGLGVLLRGEPGAGKSDLALRLVLGGPYLVAAGRKIELVADDQVLLELRAGQLVARPPQSLAGRIEVRGIGIVELEWREAAPIALVADLVAPGSLERMPEGGTFATIRGVATACIRLDPFEASAPLKLLLALDRFAGGARP